MISVVSLEDKKFNFTQICSVLQVSTAGMTILYDKCGVNTNSNSKKKENEKFQQEQDLCVKYFEKWSENHQIEFVQHLLSRMCHYQHGHINTYLKPMLQRDFISLLPSKECFEKLLKSFCSPFFATWQKICIHTCSSNCCCYKSVDLLLYLYPSVGMRDENGK